MANSHPANTMQVVSVKLYKVTKLPHNSVMRTHYNWTLKQADRQGALSLDEDGKVTAIHEESLTFDLPKGVLVEDVVHPDMLKEVKDIQAAGGDENFLKKLAGLARR